ncbi:polysaccharide deacetylase [Clostridium sp. CX1]|uniref:polysaccharide deacetylase family protein n=1 Tax=Clostridium sp. CX1 TaxID=2978346 RepID=UPI0021BEE344|nr:polysaccharide deacetylase family protein [Clostridium sp. CX1]MCT8977774.1 polysaccharide deacetylase [Clostridium sp. CX1]
MRKKRLHKVKIKSRKRFIFCTTVIIILFSAMLFNQKSSLLNKNGSSSILLSNTSDGSSSEKLKPTANSNQDNTLQAGGNKEKAEEILSVKAEEVYNFGRSNGKKYAFLTFDDGPNTSITPKILDILKKYKIHATFFVVGNAVDKNPQILKQISDDGHAIGNHTYSHNYKVLYPHRNVDVQVFKSQIQQTNNAIGNALGKTVSTRIIRFPAGSFESWKKPMREDLIKNGMYFVDWNAENRDGVKNNVSVAEQLSTIKGQITTAESSKNNVVILMHDTVTKQTTVDALPSIIELLKSEGYEFGIIK